MSVIRRLFLFVILFWGGLYLFVEIAADIGGVLWLNQWFKDEGIDKETEFRSGRADPVLRNGVVYGAKWSPDFVSEPILADRIRVKRISDDLLDFERARWEFTANDVDFHLKDAGGKVQVGTLFVGLMDYIGEVEIELDNVVATADGLAAPMLVRKIRGAFDTANSPPQFVRLSLDGLRLPEVNEGEERGSFQGIPVGEIQKELAELGYDEAEFDLRLVAGYDRKTKTLVIEECSVEGFGMAKATFALSLKDVSRDLRIGSLGDIGSAAAVVKIVGARLELEDHGLVRRAVEQRAGDRGVPVGEAALEITEDWPIGPTERAAAVAFLGDPHGLVIELVPDSPAKVLNLIGLRETEAILRRLGLRITNYSG